MSEEQLPELPKLDQWAAGCTIRMDEAQSMMREYARAAVRMERERCARICEEWGNAQTDGSGMAAIGLAAAIREGGR